MLNLTPAVVSQLIIFGIAAVIAYIIARFWNKHVKRLKKGGGKLSRAEKIGIYVFSVLIFPPLIEEILFRGPLLVFFSELNGLAWLAIFSQAVVFGLTHLNTHKMLQKVGLPAKRKSLVIQNILFGVLLGWLTLKTQTLWLPIIVHALFNLSLGLLGILIVLSLIVSLLISAVATVKKLWRRGYN